MIEKDALDKAYAFVDIMKTRADKWDGAVPMWYGWALREAFLAGIEYITNPDTIRSSNEKDA